MSYSLLMHCPACGAIHFTTTDDDNANTLYRMGELPLEDCLKCSTLHKRELKKALKAWAIREVWLNRDGTIEQFQLMNDLRTERQKQRVEDVILEVMKEWK